MKRLWSAPVLALLLAGPANAGVLATPGMFTGDETKSVDCGATNVGETPIDSVTVRLVSADGSDGEEREFTCTNLVPGAICDIVIGVPGSFVAHCKIIFTGARKNVRGSMSLTDLGNNVQAQLAAE